MTVLVDTSCIIDFLRTKDSYSTVWYELVTSGHTVAVSIVTHTELMSGKSVWEITQAYEEIKAILDNITVLPITLEISEEAGFIRAKYGLDIIDALIAATAIRNNAQLATLNKRHFEKVEGLTLA